MSPKSLMISIHKSIFTINYMVIYYTKVIQGSGSLLTHYLCLKTVGFDSKPTLLITWEWLTHMGHFYQWNWLNIQFRSISTSRFCSIQLWYLVQISIMQINSSTALGVWQNLWNEGRLQFIVGVMLLNLCYGPMDRGWCSWNNVAQQMRSLG